MIREALRAASLLLIPVQPSPVDLASAEVTLRLTHEVPGAKIRFVLNRVMTGTVLGRTARLALAWHKVPVCVIELHHRIAHAEAAAVGQPVIDYEPRGKAAEEIRALAKEVWGS
jgi:chromosome partitioning protein